MTKRVRTFVATAMALLLTVPASAGIKPKIRYIQNPTPPFKLDLTVQGEGVELYLDSLILPGGPGSWLHEALWDEYIVTIINRGDTPVTIDRLRIIDPRGIYIDPGNAVIQVEDMSRDLMNEYAAAGVAYVLASSATFAAWGLGVGVGGVVGGIALAPVAVLAAPGYILWKRGKQKKDRARIDAEFQRRMLGAHNPYGLGGSRGYTPVPGLSSIVKLGPGGSISGSNFFPTVPNPETMVLEFTRGENQYVLELPIRENIQGIHVPVEPVGQTANQAQPSHTATAGTNSAAMPPASSQTQVENAASTPAEPQATAEASECSDEQRASMKEMGLTEEQVAAACDG